MNEPAAEPPGTGPGCHLGQPASAADLLTQLAARTSSQIAHLGLPNLPADKILFKSTFCLMIQDTVSQMPVVNDVPCLTCTPTASYDQ